MSNTDLSDFSIVGACAIFVYQMRHEVIRFARLVDSTLYLLVCH